MTATDGSGNTGTDTITVSIDTLIYSMAEGSTGAFFDTDILLANPSARENIATVTFLLEDGEPVVKKFALAPTSRRTVPVSTIPEVLNRSFGIVVDFAAPGSSSSGRCTPLRTGSRSRRARSRLRRVCRESPRIPAKPVASRRAPLSSCIVLAYAGRGGGRARADD